jgi:hypothetical protein
MATMYISDVDIELYSYDLHFAPLYVNPQHFALAVARWPTTSQVQNYGKQGDCTIKVAVR